MSGGGEVKSFGARPIFYATLLRWRPRSKYAEAGRGNPMAVLYASRKLCPTCGKPMTAVADAAAGRQRYVCAACDHDPMRSPTVRGWLDGPLKPPTDPK
ncbi:hypothetical protein SAMN05216525_10155 [Bradyrhizobium sp. Gha]|nr:hypothetical protein SAMN05216525_10155 [Bradyrhizobium sp. Gha]